MISKLTAAVAALGLWSGASATPTIPLLKNLAATSQSACKLASGDGWMPAGFGMPNSVKSTGTVKGWMMFIDFPDAQGNGSDPHAVATEDWYRTSSYGKLSLEISGDTQQIYRMPATAASYPWENGMPSFYLEKYIQDALDAYMQAHNADASIFPDMDILYLIAPPTASFSRSYTYNWAAEVRMPNSDGNGTASNGNDTVSAGNGTASAGTSVAQKTVALGGDFYGGYNKKGFKAMAHETGHTLGLPDYYLTDDSGLPGDLVGGFSVMGVTFEQAPDMFGWDKWRMGWLEDSAVDCITEKGSTTHVLAPLEKKADGPDSTQAVVVATSGTTALVAEARTKNGVDDELCGPGVLLYRVDTTVPSGKGPVRVLDNLDVDLHWCGGYTSNVAPLSFQSPRKSSLTMEEWGVTVTLTEHDEATDNWTIRVDYK
ncbi:M6 metalloprotease [Apiospora marii]|uniref:M6 metalloprotease n=1 Tax=Apiospora marii TaxID=335849 RepID=A0ABR1S7K9_9PEZI